MKKLFLTIISIISFITYGQEQGTALYEMHIDGLPPEQASMMGDMTMKIVWKGDKSYIEQSSMMYEMKSVTDDKGTLMLFDQMGNKVYMKIDPNDPKYKDKEKETPEYKIEYTNETKKIAGYDCKKAVVTSKSKKGDEIKIDVWYTEQIPNHFSKQKYAGRRGQSQVYMKELKGMPLEYTTPMGQVSVKITAKEINFNPVSDDIFKLSTEGYKEINPDEFGKGGK